MLRCPSLGLRLSRLCLLLVPGSCWATAVSDLSLLNEADLLVEIPMVSSATRLSQKRAEAPASITLIDREMIEASGAQEIPDLLRLVPGFQTYQVNAHKFGVTTHGLGETQPGRLEVMIDGRSVYLPALSSVDWRSLGIGLSDIDSIEVVRGSNVPAYGSNAFLGAINISTRSAFKDRGTRIETLGGSENSGRLELSHNDHIGNLGVRLSAGYLQNDGFGIGDLGQGRYVNLRTTATPALSDTLELQLGFSQGHAGIGASFLPILQRSYDANYQALSWSRDLNSTDNLRIQLYHNYFKATMEPMLLSEAFGSTTLTALESLYNKPFNDEPFNVNLEEGDTERFDLELQHQLHLLPELRAVWGLGGRRDLGQSEDLFHTTATLSENQWRLFGNLEWHASKALVWNLGAMSEYNPDLGSRSSPRLGVNYQLNTHHSLRASYTLAYRIPSLLDRHLDARLTHSNGTELAQLLNVDPNLQPEENRTLELGYLGTLPALKLEIDLKLFHEQVTRGIGRIMSPDPLPLNPVIRTGSNNNHWRSNGLETQLKFRPGKAFWLALQYSYLDLEGLSAGGDLPSGDLDLNSMAPRHSLGLLASHRLPADWALSLNYYQQSATGYFDGDPVDHYRRLDSRLAKTLKGRNTQTQIALVLQNLLGHPQTEFQQRNRFDRRAYLSLALQFL